jgi:hypothetical protein
MILKKMPATPLPTPAEILAAIPKPPAIAQAESRLATLRSIGDSLIACAAEAYRGEGFTPTEFAREIAADRQKNAAEITQARAALAAASEAHVTRLKAAIAPHRVAALNTFRRAYGDLLDAWTALDEIDDALRAAAPGSVKRRATVEQARLLYGRLVADRLVEA